MNHDSDSSAGPLRRRDEFSQDQPFSGHDKASTGRTRSWDTQQPSGKVDAWTFIDLFLARWYWVLLSAIIFGGIFFYLGSKLIGPKFTAVAQLLRYETPLGESFKTPPMTAETFSGVIRSPELLRAVSERAYKEKGIPPIPPEKLTKLIKIDPEPDSEIVKISLAQPTDKHAVDLLNLYIDEAVNFTTGLQRQQADKIARDYLKSQVDRMSNDIAELHREFRNMPMVPFVTNQLGEVSKNLNAMSGGLAAPGRQAFQVAEQSRRLQMAMNELADLLVKYTEIHPLVIAKSNEVVTLEHRLQEASTNTAPGNGALASGMSMALLAQTRPGETPFNPELDIVRTKLLSLEQGRVDLANRYHEAELFAANPPGVVRVFAPGDLKTTQGNMRWAKVGIVAIFGGFLGMVAALAIVLLVEFADSRVKTVDDLRRVTRLPVLTSLGNLHHMSPDERSQWAFRTWTLLQGRLSPSPNHGLVCGITSSTKGEGRSTWIRLLADAASLTGFRVLTIATRPSPSYQAKEDSSAQRPEEAQGQGPQGSDERPPREEKEMNGNTQTPVEARQSGPNGKSSSALTSNVLTSPMQVTEQLVGPNSQPMVHIPLPGWVWNLERRKQWGEALSHWRKIENLVILVELPPCSVPEAVLLGSNLPNMVWLCDSGRADAAETRAQLQTLRDARCNLVGAVLNREGAPSLKRRFSRWMGMMALASFVALTSTANAQTGAVTNRPAGDDEPALQPGAPAAEDAMNARRPGSFSIVHPSQKAAWQQHLTVGPGDVLSIGLFGSPELTRAEVTVGPDGRIGFLEAHDVQAAGLTIDELRGRLDQELGKYRRAARSVVTPVAFKSKKYFILGKVMTKGVYSLDRPMTVLEAIARAKGLESGLVDRNIIDVADVQRAFLARGGKRIPLDFEKLFNEGDLSQNIAIEPGDYIYFPPADVQEVYVVGEVRSPGAVTYTRNLTIIGAITGRGGYTERAYKMRVLVVRGSVNRPEGIIVDTHAILDGREPDFKLKPKDVIYVNFRPFIRVEELADMAATAFLQSLITSWVGVDVVSPVGE